MANALTRFLTAMALCIGLQSLPLAAQAPSGLEIAPEFLDQTLRQGDNTLRFCLNPASALEPLDRAVAQAIADTLLLNAEFHEVAAPFVIQAYDFQLQIGGREFFIAFHNNCEAFMGLRLAPGQLPDWLSISQPYFSARTVLASATPGIDSFADIPPGAIIGSRLQGSGDVSLISYLRSLRESTRPRRFPYPDYETLIERLTDGTAVAILIWEPALYFASGGDPARIGITAIFDPPHAVPPLDFGVAVMARNTFTRGLIDQAITALRDDGTLDALAREHAMLQGD